MPDHDHGHMLDRTVRAHVRKTKMKSLGNLTFEAEMSLQGTVVQTSSLNLGTNTSKNMPSRSKHKAKTLAAAAKTLREQKHYPLDQKHAQPPMQSTCVCMLRVATNHVRRVVWSHMHARTCAWLLVDSRHH